jgi:type I restriction enzyme S subunit
MKKEINILPENWSMAKMYDTGLIVSGGTPDTSKPEYWDGEISWCTPTDITSLKGARYIRNTTRRITEAGLKNSSASVLPTQSLVVCTRATIGDCAINISPLTTNQGFKAIIPNQNWSVEFLYYLMVSMKKKLTKLSSGSTFLELSKRAFENIDIQSPPLFEQKKIAEILFAIDDKIDLINIQIAETEKLKNGLMHTLLTKGIGHTKFKNSELGEIPENWRVIKLIETSVNGISNGVFNDPKKVGKGFKLINVVNMYSGDCIDTSELQLLELENIEFEKNKVEYGDVFFTRSSLVAEGIAHCNVNLSHENTLTYDGHLMRIRPNSELIIPKFLNYFCKTNSARCFLISRGKTATMTTIGQKDIADLPIVVPSIQEQEKIIEILSTVEDKIGVLKKKKLLYQKLKTGLMQQLLTGKIRVNIYQQQSAVA